jgi:hypothetical protein
MPHGPLGRRPPTDFAHVERYPLTEPRRAGVVSPTPVVIGVNWYVEFDRPEKDSKGRWWVARDDRLTTVRGGHCVCLRPAGSGDPDSWWEFYDQGDEGACVGFGISRLTSHLNRKRYDGFELYRAAKKVDEWPGEDYDGTSVRAGLDVLRTQGHWLVTRGHTRAAQLSEGVAANRWVTSIKDCLSVLGTPNGDSVEVLNSWGRSYPHVVHMPASVLERLWREDGEIGVVTDR